MTRLRALVTRLRAIGGRLATVPPRRRDAAGLTAAIVVWVAGLALVAAAGQAVVIQRVDRGPEPGAATVTIPTTGVDTVADLPTFGPGGTADLGALLGLDPATVTPETLDDLGVSDPLASAPAKATLLPALPVITLPPLPTELAPLLAITSPSVRQVCSTTGVAIVVAALVKGDLESAGIPVSEALTYLGPILSTCALFPADEPSICSVDKALNDAVIPKDLQILVGVPPLAALGIDQVASVETLLRSTGVPLPPDITMSIANGLGCELR